MINTWWLLQLGGQHATAARHTYGQSLTRIKQQRIPLDQRTALHTQHGYLPKTILLEMQASDLHINDGPRAGKQSNGGRHNVTKTN